jgi:hypothetical protein
LVKRRGRRRGKRRRRRRRKKKKNINNFFDFNFCGGGCDFFGLTGCPPETQKRRISRAFFVFLDLETTRTTATTRRIFLRVDKKYEKKVFLELFKETYLS